MSWSQWCYLTISSSATLFSFWLQSFPASGSFPKNWLFGSAGLSIGASASASVLPMNIQGWFPWGLTGLISLLSPPYRQENGVLGKGVCSSGLSACSLKVSGLGFKARVPTLRPSSLPFTPWGHAGPVWVSLALCDPCCQHLTPRCPGECCGGCQGRPGGNLACCLHCLSIL